MLGFLVNAILIILMVGVAIIGVGALILAFSKTKIDFFETFAHEINADKNTHTFKLTPDCDKNETRDNA